MTIKLIKSTFINEQETKTALAEFIMNAEKLSMGKMCEQFEQDLSKFQGTQYSVVFSSGSAANLALIQASMNLGLLKTGDRVAFSALTWATNVMPLIQLGLTPVALDVELENLNVGSKTLIESHKTNPIKAFFITNLLGFCADLAEIKSYCQQNNILLLEDNCESFGSSYQQTLLGNFGLASTFSFFVGHHLSSIEGGAVCTSDFKMYEMLKMCRAHGWSRNLSKESAERLKTENKISDFYDLYTFYELAYNLRPTEITGFIGCSQLKFANASVEKRISNFDRFLAASLENDDLVHLKIKGMNQISNFAFPIILKDEKTFRTYLNRFKDADVEVRPIVGGDMTLQPFYKKHVHSNTHMPNAAAIHQNGFYIPNNPELTEEEVATLCTLIRKG